MLELLSQKSSFQNSKKAHIEEKHLTSKKEKSSFCLWIEINFVSANLQWSLKWQFSERATVQHYRFILIMKNIKTIFQNSLTWFRTLFMLTFCLNLLCFHKIHAKINQYCKNFASFSVYSELLQTCSKLPMVQLWRHSWSDSYFFSTFSSNDIIISAHLYKIIFH